MSVATKLLTALRKIDRAGSFVCSGSVADAAPGLVIDGFGPVGFPFNAVQAKTIREFFRQAPYGQGEKTLVDTSVRQVRVLDPDGFQLTGKKWDKTLAGIVEKVQDDLGLKAEKVEAHLYNLLLYEKGSFFLPHRDGERLDRMVATLVIVLPCAFEGGELLVRHGGQEQSLTFGAGEDPDGAIHYAAFYADCEHEVRPLISGQRLCLVYNLTLGKQSKSLSVPSASEHVEAIARELRDWAVQGQPKRLALALSHQYSQDGLRWDALKGTDRLQAEALAEAARQTDFVVYLALVTLWEAGDGEDDGWELRNRRGRRYSYDDEDEDNEKEAEVEVKIEIEDDRSEGKHTMLSVNESSLVIDHWRDPSGGQPDLIEMPIEEEEVVPPEAVTEFKPREEYEGFTGNAGCPLQRWYHRAVLVLWPRKRHFAVVADCGSWTAVATLTDLLEDARKLAGPARERAVADCHALAAEVLSGWKDRYGGSKPRKGLELAGLLHTLGDPELVRSYLVNVLASNSISAEPGLVKLLDQHGWATFRRELLALFATTDHWSVTRNGSLLELLATASTKDPARNEICAELADRMLGDAETAHQKQPFYFYGQSVNDFQTTMVRTLSALRDDARFDRFLALQQAYQEIYPLQQQIDFLLALHKSGVAINPMLARWIESCRKQLQAMTGPMPTPPTDLRREACFKCNCEWCVGVRKFLESPTQDEHRVSKNIQTRKHVEEQLRGCDVTTATLQNEKPLVLVIHKTQASYKAALKAYNEHLAVLASVNALLDVPTAEPKKSTRKKKKP